MFRLGPVKMAMARTGKEGRSVYGVARRRVRRAQTNGMRRLCNVGKC